MRIDLDDLEIEALRDFDVGQKIKMPQCQVVSVVGRNLDDGGSNGTGKTTFASAAPILLFGPKVSGISSTSLKNRYLSTPSRVAGGLRIDGELLLIDRTIGGKLKIKVGNTDWQEGKAEDIQEKINKIIRVTQDQLLMLSNKAQGEYGGFLLMKDSDKKSFLSSFFDVKFIEEAKKKAALELADKDRLKTSLDGQFQHAESLLSPLKKRMDESYERFNKLNSDEFKASVKALEDQIKTLEENKSAMDIVLLNFEEYAMGLDEIRKVSLEANEKLKGIDTELKDLKEQVSQKTHELEGLKNKLNSIPTVPVELNQELDQINLVLREITSRQKKHQELSTKEAVMRSNSTRLLEQLKKADESSCKLCGSKLSEAKIKSIKVALESEYLQISEDLAKNEGDLHAVFVSEEDVKRVHDLKADIAQRITSFTVENSKEAVKKDYDNASRLITALSTTIKGMETHRQVTSQLDKIAVGRLRDQTVNASMDLSVKVTNLKSIVTSKLNELSLSAQDKDRTSADYVKATEDLVAIEKKRVELQSEIDILTGVVDVTSQNGFVGYIFDNILEDLNSEINVNLKMIPNARKFSLQFTPDKVVKTTGSINKDITHQIFSGTEEVEFKTLSGGEKLSVIIAVDEALDDVLSRRLGVSVGWKFLDEQFSWIDENSKEALLEFYKAKSNKKAYFIVDHASEFNASLDKRIVIIKQNNLARFSDASNDL